MPLLDAGVTFSKRVRFIFGTDEETLWRGINRYKKNEELPAMGFTPDACFPLVYVEKGLLQCVLEGENSGRLQLTGCSAFNAVPDSATFHSAHQEDLADELQSRGYEYARNDTVLIVAGKAAHAMEPENGINAITRLCIAIDVLGTESRAVGFITREVGEDPLRAAHLWPMRRQAVRATQIQRGQDRRWRESK
jgi:succinyl-diaminopimelate desuccinylase